MVFFLTTRLNFLLHLSDCQHFIAFIVWVFIRHSVWLFYDLLGILDWGGGVFGKCY